MEKSDLVLYNINVFVLSTQPFVSISAKRELEYGVMYVMCLNV